MRHPKHGLDTRRSVTAGRLATFGLGSTAFGASAFAQLIHFGEPDTYPESGGISGIATADFDRDASQDLIVIGTESVDLYLNDGSGSLTRTLAIPFENSVTSIAVADMDQDGDADAVWGEYLLDRTRALTIWYNDGDGRSGETIRIPLPGALRSDIALSDFNLDGRTDILYFSDYRTISAVFNRGNRLFEEQELYTYGRTFHKVRAMSVGDVDGDGDVDVTATMQYIEYDVEDSQLILLNNEDGASLRLAWQLELPWTPESMIARAMALGDFDGDGDLDVVIHASSLNFVSPNELLIARNDGNRSLSIGARYRAVFESAGDVMPADVNTDGRLDLVFVNATTFGVYVVRNEGDFAFVGMTPFHSGIRGSSARTADLSGDGQIDLIQGGSGSDGGLVVLPNTTTLRGPTLAHTQVRRGREAAFAVGNAEPGERAYFLFSTEVAGPSLGVPVLGGLTLDLQDPVVVAGSAVAGPSGRAVLHVQIPQNAPSDPVTVQAVIRRGARGAESVKTPFLSFVIEP